MSVTQVSITAQQMQDIIAVGDRISNKKCKSSNRKSRGWNSLDTDDADIIIEMDQLARLLGISRTENWDSVVERVTSKKQRWGVAISGALLLESIPPMVHEITFKRNEVSEVVSLYARVHRLETTNANLLSSSAALQSALDVSKAAVCIRHHHHHN